MMSGALRGALRGQGRYAGKAYFFQGKRYWRYDLKKDYGEVDYPHPLGLWKLPGSFYEGIDACVAGVGVFQRYAYFFRGPFYAKYDWQPETAGEPRPVARWSANSPFPFSGGIDAALTGQGRYAGKTYFFKGDRYARYNWNSDTFDLLDQSIARWKLGDRFASDLTACLDSDEGTVRTPVAYFFKGDKYVKFDWKADRARDGYPMLIPAGWPTGCAVWAVHSQFPTIPCGDPRLDAGKAWIAYPFGSISGQAGWQASVKFATIEDLTAKLSSLKIPAYYGDDGAGDAIVPPGRITRLAICAHGMGGALNANGPNAMSDWRQAVTDDRLLQDRDLRAGFGRIARMLAPSANVLLLGCEVGQTQMGRNFLMTLSELLRGHPVTGLTSYGYGGGPNSKREGEGCSEVGMRDTRIMRHSRSQRQEDERVAKNWPSLEAWPWAWERSPSAKVALDGKIIKEPEGDML